MENHPRINSSNLIIQKSKIILGSFPTWALSGPDFEKQESVKVKELERKKNEELKYFYGSSINRFWGWYENYIDHHISKDDIISIQNSLNENAIGITDVILSCSRKGKSALDKNLTNRIYNHQFFKYPKQGHSIKIICTSKGVMNEMLLSRKFFKLHPRLKINSNKSNFYQIQLLNKIKGDIEVIRNPFYQLIEIESGGSIECISLPSPGSPYRRLIDFGFNSNDADAYLNNYLRYAFDWFNS